MSIAEAINYNLLIVATNVGGIKDLLKNNENAYVSEPGNINSLIINLKKSLKKNKSNKLMIKRSKSFILNQFINKKINNTIKVLKYK